MKVLNHTNINYFAVHCSATAPVVDVGVDEIRQWHLDKDWHDIGYHFVIRRNGILEPGRSTRFQGAHVRDHNHESIGICLVGGVDEYNDPEDNFEPIQKQTLGLFLKGLRTIWGNAKVQGHRDFPNVAKDCPCFDVKEWWRQYNQKEGIL